MDHIYIFGIPNTKKQNKTKQKTKQKQKKNPKPYTLRKLNPFQLSLLQGMPTLVYL